MMWIPSISQEIEPTHCNGFIRNRVSHDVDSKHCLGNRLNALPRTYT
jgi:hypothetical protein